MCIKQKNVRAVQRSCCLTFTTRYLIASIHTVTLLKKSRYNANKIR